MPVDGPPSEGLEVPSTGVGVDGVGADAPPQRIVVAGGSGYVGRVLTRRLAAAGHNVVVIARRADRVEWRERLEVIGADVSETCEQLVTSAHQWVNST